MDKQDESKSKSTGKLIAHVAYESLCVRTKNARKIKQFYSIYTETRSMDPTLYSKTRYIRSAQSLNPQLNL